MTKRQICYDLEFHEDGHTIDLISIGLVDAVGHEYYAVSSDFDVARSLLHPWLVENVWPYLPQRPAPIPMGRNVRGMRVAGLDTDHPDVKPRAQIRDEVQEFLLTDAEPELWAWYGAYDHVSLMQLWGPMVTPGKPDLPMFTNDLRQSLAQLERHLGYRLPLPQQGLTEHNALADARHNWVVKRHLERIAHSIGICL